MDKKRKSQDNNTDSIDTNKKKKGKKTKDITENVVNDHQNIESLKDDSEKVIHVSKKKRKDKKNKEEIAESIVENHDGKISVQNSSNKIRKDKEIKDKISKDNDEDVNEFTESAVRSTNNFRAITNSGTPKKIIFVNDEPQEVSVTAKSKTNKSKAFKKSKEHNDILREEDVKDEDIDKFCDELGEEDNQQYENWVQLIEASLSSNKKKP